MICPECSGKSRYVRQCGLCLGVGYVSFPKALMQPDKVLTAIAWFVIGYAVLLASITGWGS